MKRPSIQFYPSDWLRDTALRSCSIGARGLWIDLICYMHEGTPYGHLKVKHKVILPVNLCSMIGLTLSEIEGYLSELFDAGVFEYDSDGAIFSKRMVRDEEIRKARSDGGKKGGNPNLVNQEVNLPDNLVVNHEVEKKVKQNPTPSSSSSSSSSNKKHIDDFETFWKAYPRKTAKKNAEKAWMKAKPDLNVVLSAIEVHKKTEQWTKNNGTFIPHPASWINQERWNDQLTIKKEINFGKLI